MLARTLVAHVCVFDPHPKDCIGEGQQLALGTPIVSSGMRIGRRSAGIM